VFGALATGFSVLLGFIVFLAFSSYDESKTGAETEALVVVQQFETAQFLPPAAGRQLSGELICYGRSVVGQEWPRMQTRAETGAVNPWGLAMFRTMKGVQPTTATEQSAYDRWLDQTSTREEARRDRVHASEGVIPAALWRVLYFIAAVIVVYMLFFADSGERAGTQGLLMGSLVAVMVATLLLSILDNPTGRESASCARSPCNRPSSSSTRPATRWARTTRCPATPRASHSDRPGPRRFLCSEDRLVRCSCARLAEGGVRPTQAGALRRAALRRGTGRHIPRRDCW